MKEKKQKKHWPLLVGFFVIVSVAVSVSAGLKIAEIASRSHFDGTHHFTVAVLHADGVEVVSLEPGDRAVHVRVDKPSQQKLIASQLPFLVDGFVTITELKDSSTKGLFWRLLSQKKNLDGVTQLDLLRLYVALVSIADSSIDTQEASLPLPDGEWQRGVVDDVIASENMTIAIENATSASGVGSRVATLLESLGGRVVSVTTARVNQEGTLVITAEEVPSYTATKIASMLETDVTLGNPGTSDILVRVGSRSLRQDFFGTL